MSAIGHRLRYLKVVRNYRCFRFPAPSDGYHYVTPVANAAVFTNRRAAIDVRLRLTTARRGLHDNYFDTLSEHAVRRYLRDICQAFYLIRADRRLRDGRSFSPAAHLTPSRSPVKHCCKSDFRSLNVADLTANSRASIIGSVTHVRVTVSRAN